MSCWLISLSDDFFEQRCFILHMEPMATSLKEKRTTEIQPLRGVKQFGDQIVSELRGIKKKTREWVKRKYMYKNIFFFIIVLSEYVHQ